MDATVVTGTQGFFQSRTVCWLIASLVAYLGKTYLGWVFPADVQGEIVTVIIDGLAFAVPVFIAAAMHYRRVAERAIDRWF